MSSISTSETGLTLVGRSSSHFTRATRLVAAELGVRYAFHVVRDLTSLESADYANNPALKLPILLAESGTWFGSLNICRELARIAGDSGALIWPEALTTPLLANAQELVLQAMANEVTLIMSAVGRSATAEPTPYEAKLRSSIQKSLSWLNHNLAAFLAGLSGSQKQSFLEVTLFCLVEHLEFRQICSVREFPALCGFRERFGERESARQTAFRFD